MSWYKIKTSVNDFMNEFGFPVTLIAFITLIGILYPYL